MLWWVAVQLGSPSIQFIFHEYVIIRNSFIRNFTHVKFLKVKKTFKTTFGFVYYNEAGISLHLKPPKKNLRLFCPERAACMHCYGTKCPLLTASFLFLLSPTMTVLLEGVFVGFRNFAWGFMSQKNKILGKTNYLSYLPPRWSIY
jgi:hypothetical protein